MYKTVFISHSRDDPNLGFFHKIFSTSPVKSIWMEFEDIKPPPSIFIKDSVDKSDALFVLLSQHLVNKQQTNNWVSFEVGLAANRNLDIYVFEPMDESVNFAVPWFTHYMQYSSTDKGQMLWLRNRLRDGFLMRSGVPIKCPWSDCQIEFRYFSRFYADSYTCPACRKEVTFRQSFKEIDWDKLREDVSKAIGKALKEEDLNSLGHH